MQKLISAGEEELIIPVQPELNFTSFLRTIKRNIMPIIGIAGIVTGIVWVSNRNHTPIYEGGFQLLVEPVSSEARLAEPSNLTGSSKQINTKQLEMDYSTIIALLKSPKMLSPVVDKIKTKYPEITIEKLTEDLVIERIGTTRADQTKIIKVTYQHDDPELVELVLGEISQKYLQYSLEERKSRIGQGVEFIEKQLPELYSRVNTLQVNLQTLQEQNQLIDPQTKGQDLLEQISLLKAQQIETQNELNKQKALKNSLQQQLKINPSEAIVVSTLSEDPNYQSLLQKYKEIESEISLESARFESNTPTIQKLEDKKANLLNLLTKEKQRILGGQSSVGFSNSPLLNLQNTILSGMTQQLVDAITQIKLLEVQNQNLTTTISQYEQQALKIPQISRQYTKLQQELAIASQTLQQLLTQKDNLSVELAQSEIPWEIVSQPQLAKDEDGNLASVSMTSEKKLLAALIGGLLAGVAATAFLEKFHNTFYSAEDIEDIIKSPLLETITWEETPKLLPQSNLLVEAPDHYSKPVLESFKSLYANLRLRFTEPPIRSLVVSSAIKGDEQLPIAWNLAETAVATGQKVLLVDANLLEPQLHVQCNLPNQVGLSNLLAEQTDWQEVIQRSPDNNLSVLTSGQVPLNFSKLLTSNRMEKLIKEFEQVYDLVIYDTPPILNNMDTSFLAAHTDGLLMTVTIGRTKKSLVTQALNQIKNLNLKLLGVISTETL
ncbi:lipopolysaccharide biosynthesis protein [Chondrocystis sp. NIES-4102]|nr:lipopolysaccharide biosynthesis protein [Chondrocystis sp. NIES-4102]